MEDRIIIHFGQILRFLIKKIWLFVLLMAVFIGGGIVLARVSNNASVSYSAVGKLLVVQRAGGISGEMLDNYSRIQAIYDAKEILVSGKFLEGVKERLDSDISVAMLKSSIMVEQVVSTRILNITVTGEDPDSTMEIMEEVQEYAEVYLAEVLPDIEATRLDERDIIPVQTEQNSVNGIKTGILMGGASCVILAGILIVMYLSNCSVRYIEDVERYLGLPVAGEIRLNKKSKR